MRLRICHSAQTKVEMAELSGRSRILDTFDSCRLEVQRIQIIHQVIKFVSIAIFQAH